MANDFMRNANKVSLDGEVVSFSNTFPIVDVKEDVVETPIVEEPKKTRKTKAKKEEKVEKTVVETKEEEKEEDEETTEETIEDDEE
jgi:hypothetical protein